jgi:hypothetical protein
MWIVPIGAAVVAASASAYLRAADTNPAMPKAAVSPSSVTSQRALLDQYCVSCHNDRVKSGNLALDRVDLTRAGQDPQLWEKVVRKLRAGLMPPVGRPRPDDSSYDGFRMWLQDELDRAAAAHPDPGRTEIFHRLNRTEYHNAIRDLLGLDIDITDLLPADDSSYGFDNIAGVLKISPSLMERYLDAAKTISRLAVGAPLPAVDSKTYRMVPDLEQHERQDDLPFGTRGGTLIHHLFPQDGEYEIRLEVGGAALAREPDRVEITIDGQQVKVITLTPRAGRGRQPAGAIRDPESRLTARLAIKAGPRDVGVAFYKKPLDLIEDVRDPFPNPRISGNDGGAGGAGPYLTGVTVVGPFSSDGAGDTPSRRRVFTCHPATAADEPRCARTILATLARRAYRGFGTDEDLGVLLDFYKQGRGESADFERGIEFALRRLLVDPQFLFRLEPDPIVARRAAAAGSRAAGQAQQSYRLSDLQLASRLSFFLWSSIPDDELLDVAAQGKLKDAGVLDRQVTRMLSDQRSEALTKNFAGQWLLLRNIETVRPGDPYSLAFDETLRRSFQRETELFFDSVVRENRSVLELLTANYTFLNERLAGHYGIPNVQGSHFRRVTLPDDSPRRGILGQGSVLTITSHAIRTSPVIRGKWILNNILGTPPPDPPPNVPALVDRKTQAKVQTMRERMSQHRANAVCASCHNMIDPAGFALENFDAIGRWRTVDESYNPIDASGALPDGTKFNGVVELRAALVRRPERFVNTVTEKLLTFALGRGLEYYDMPAVRRIVADSAAEGYRFPALVAGVVRSYPFLMRRAEPAATATQAATGH